MKPRNERQRLLEEYVYPEFAAAFPDFRRRRASFVWKGKDVVHTVQLQTSQFPHPNGVAEFTVNFFCQAVPLANAFDYWSTTPAVNTAHWCCRLGDYLEPAQDKWWRISDAASSKRVAQEVRQLLQLAAADLERMQSTMQLIGYWLDGGNWRGALGKRENILVAAMEWLDGQQSVEAAELSVCVERYLRALVHERPRQ